MAIARHNEASGLRVVRIEAEKLGKVGNELRPAAKVMYGLPAEEPSGLYGVSVRFALVIPIVDEPRG